MNFRWLLLAKIGGALSRKRPFIVIKMGVAFPNQSAKIFLGADGGSDLAEKKLSVTGDYHSIVDTLDRLNLICCTVISRWRDARSIEARIAPTDGL